MRDVPFWVEVVNVDDPDKRYAAQVPYVPVSVIVEHFGGKVLSKNYDYKEKAKGWWRALCPWHEDRKPSASVNPALNVFNCHACGVKGGPMALLTKACGMSEEEAKGWLMKKHVEHFGDLPAGGRGTG
jgi:hypothetical protein